MKFFRKDCFTFGNLHSAALELNNSGIFDIISRENWNVPVQNNGKNQDICVDVDTFTALSLQFSLKNCANLFPLFRVKTLRRRSVQRSPNRRTFRAP